MGIPRWARGAGRLFVGTVVAGVVALVAVGCGGDDIRDGSGTGAGELPPDFQDNVDTVGIEAVVDSDGRSITVRTEPVPVEAPGGDCAAQVIPVAEEYGGESADIMVSFEVRADRPRMADPDVRDANGAPVLWDGCELAPRQVTIPLEYPVGRPVRDPFGSQFWIQDGRWVGCDHVVMTCIVDPASCDNGTLRDTIANSDVPRHFGMGNQRCEEPYAVVDVDVGAGACPVTGEASHNPCAGENIRRLYFQIEGEAWTVVGSDPGPGCGAIGDMAPDFPTHLCQDLPAVAGR